MAHHQRYDHARATTSSIVFSREDGSPGTIQLPEDEDYSDQDEPPDNRLSFDRLPICSYTSSSEERERDPTRTRDWKSLLTQGLLMSPNSTSMECPGKSATQIKSPLSKDSSRSFASTTELTSDGGTTSPFRTIMPSPPLPFTYHTSHTTLQTKELAGVVNICLADVTNSPQLFTTQSGTTGLDKSRKRCITFACSHPVIVEAENPSQLCRAKEAAESKRSSILRFACPSKPREDAEPLMPDTIKTQIGHLPWRQLLASRSSTLRHVEKQPSSSKTQLLQQEKGPLVKQSRSSEGGVGPNHGNFHEFALPQDDWTGANPLQRRKITINDTLWKENAIRILGEEAEAEAVQEEQDEAEPNVENYDDAHDEDEIEEDMENDGNETDDEEGFAASDDESDDDSEAGSSYQSWTPGLTTAATSTDHLEHIRLRRRRRLSESSTGSTSNAVAVKFERARSSWKLGESESQHVHAKIRPRSPELPDSTDFVCGTLDEDKPLEAAYMSCLKRRKKKHGAIPQDLDPSFPLSESEQQDDTENDVLVPDSNQAWTLSYLNYSDSGHRRGRVRVCGEKGLGSPAFSPRRLRSSAPKRRKSPAPVLYKPFIDGRFSVSRHLQACSSQYSISPLQDLNSLSDTRQPRTQTSHRTRRPNSVRTESFPRPRYPIWRRHSATNAVMVRGDMTESHTDRKVVPEVHSRGPIDIFQGLERKRLRRKENFWRQHCRSGGKEKERRSQPGEGAEKMRELGLEMTDRRKAYGPRLQVVFSI